MAVRNPAGGDRGDRERTVPRRVKHLIVLPGGADPDLDPGAGAQEPLDAVDEAPAPGGAHASSIARGGPSPVQVRNHTASAVAAQAAEAVPDSVVAPSSFKLRLTVIARSVSASRAPGMPFIVLACVLVSAAVLGLVVLRVMVDQASFQVDSLDARVAAQQAQVGQLRYAVSVQEAPDHLAAAAAQLGLVPAGAVQAIIGPGASSPTSTATAPSTAAAAGPAPPAKRVAGSPPPGAGSGRR
jgi:hypothetical protein